MGNSHKYHPKDLNRLLYAHRWHDQGNFDFSIGSLLDTNSVRVQKQSLLKATEASPFYRYLWAEILRRRKSNARCGNGKAWLRMKVRKQQHGSPHSWEKSYDWSDMQVNADSAVDQSLEYLCQSIMIQRDFI